MTPLEIMFHTDGAGVVWDPHEPHHLDAILSYHWRMVQGLSMDCDPDAPPEDSDLPLARWEIGGVWGWRASVLFPCNETAESVQWARKRFDETRIHLQSSPVVNTAAGLCKTTNKAWPLTLARTWRAWCVGDQAGVEALAGRVRAIGRERGRGRGHVWRVEVQLCERDWSMIRGGLAMRYLPKSGAPRIVRPRPPYWHTHGSVECASVGDSVGS